MCPDSEIAHYILQPHQNAITMFKKKKKKKKMKKKKKTLLDVEEKSFRPLDPIDDREVDRDLTDRRHQKFASSPVAQP